MMFDNANMLLRKVRADQEIHTHTNKIRKVSFPFENFEYKVEQMPNILLLGKTHKSK